jgi:ABC-type polysaccharide/polyol phosphate export permease
MITNLTKFKQDWGELVGQLTKREIKARYKQSILGYAWIILVPLVRLIVMTLVFSVFFKVDTGDIPYAIFLFVGLVPWMFTSNGISAATSSLNANASLITKIKMPRIIFPLSAVMVVLVDLGLSALVLFAMLLIFSMPVYLTWLWVPIIFGVQFILVLGVGLFLAAANIFYRDVQNMLELFLLVWMYLSPIIYPPEFIPEQYRSLFNLNPMMGIVNSYRNTILHGMNPPWESFIYAIVISLLIFVFAFKYFKSKEKFFADVV